MPTDAQSWERLLEAFSEAVELPPGPERDALLAWRLDTDPALLSEAIAMLRTHDEADPPDIERKLLHLTEVCDLSGTVVGSYRLVRLIARGGMGEVYEAEREGAPFRQQVALKLLRLGVADMEARVRFRQERQILARLIHPLIVPLLDGGVTPTGQPWLVMQHVEGQAITEYCASHNSSLEERLRLACDVGRAIEYAHRNLIVHRDLKPSNIVVSADGQARLLDFGVAKMLDSEVRGAPVTRSEVRIMTIDYAAPEQLRGEPITTATDVYGLGALLYELLAGERAFLAARLTHGSLEREILEVEPERPSLVAARKGLAFSASLKGDLDTIVLKAMAKEPGQRFASAEEFVRDLERYLAGQPVTARKPSLSYRVSKFVRRNRLATAATISSVVLLLGLASSIILQSQRVSRERDVARIEQQRANQVVSLLVDLFATANPEKTPGGSDMSIGEFLNRVEGAITSNRDIDRAVQAQLRRTLGNVHQARGEYPQARRHLEAALEHSRILHGEKHAETAAALHDIARLTITTGPPDAALKLIRQSLEVHRALHGEKHETVAQNMEDLSRVLNAADEKWELLEKALAIRRSLTTTPTQGMASNLNALGFLAWESRDATRARGYFEESLAIAGQVFPPGHPFRFMVMGNLAVCYQRFRQYGQAERLYRTLIAERARIVGPESHGIGTVYGNLGTLLAHQGKHSEAEGAFRRALTILENSLGPVHHEVANAKRNLGAIRVLRRDPEGGRRMLHEAAEIFRRNRGEVPGYWFMVSQEAVARACSGRGAEAERQLRDVVGELARATGPSAVDTSRVHLGYVLLQRGKAAEAEALFRLALEARNRTSPLDEESVAEAESGLGAALILQGKAEGREILHRSLPKFRAWGLANPYFVALASGNRSDLYASAK